jgi:hypothetical protein
MTLFLLVTPLSEVRGRKMRRSVSYHLLSLPFHLVIVDSRFLKHLLPKLLLFKESLKHHHLYYMLNRAIMTNEKPFKPALIIVDFQEDFCPPVS